MAQWAPDCLASRACVPGSNHAASAWGWELLVWQLFNTPLYIYHSHTRCSCFHYETYIGISPYRTLAVYSVQCMVVYVMYNLIVWENTNVVHFSSDMLKYSTCSMNKVERVLYFPISHTNEHRLHIYISTEYLYIRSFIGKHILKYHGNAA